MKKYYYFLLITSLFFNNSFGQLAPGCESALPFCAGAVGNGISFPNTTNAPSVGGYSCLGSQPNAAWYYLRISQSGNLVFQISQLNAAGVGIDVDFIAWGPFGTAPTCGVTNLNATTQVPNPIPHIYPTPGGCSYNPAAIEFLAINNALVGEYYMVLMTNFANQPGTISLVQTSGTGATSCDILCPLSITGGNTSTCANTTLTANYLNSVVSPTTTFNWTYLCSGCTTPPVPVTGSAPITTTTPRGTKSNLNQPLPSGTYSVTATSPGCLNPEPATTVILPPVQAPINPPIVVEACTDATFNLTSNTSVVLAGLTGSYTVRYHHEEFEAIDADPFIGDTSITPVESLTNYVGTEGETIWMSITDNVLGCITTTSFTLHFVSCAFTAENTGPICEGGTFGLTANAGEGYTYIWTGPNGYTSTEQNPINIPQPTTPPFTYNCVATNGTITSNSSTTLFVKPKPVAVTTLIQPNLLTDVQTICTGGITDFGLSSLISGATFTWTVNTSDVSGATPASGNTIIQTLNNSSSNIGTAIYTITPTADGCVGETKDITITVNPAPVAIATPTPDTICSGETTNILLTSLPAGATFSWTGTQTDITGVFPSSGQTIAQTLSATTLIGNANYVIVPSLGDCVGDVTRVVQNVNPIPNVTATPERTALCSGDSTVIPLTSLVTGTTFAWTVVSNTNITGANAGNGNTINQSLTNTSSLPQTIDYLITPTANGCVGATVTVSITVQPIPLAAINYSGTPFCASTSFANVTFTGAIGGVYSSNPLGLLFDANGNVDLASPAGTYTVSYTIAANGGCPEAIFTTPITINSITTPFTDFSYTTPVCRNSTTIVRPFPVSGFTSGGTYTSTTGLIIDSNTGIIDLTLSTAGDYTVTYTVPATTCGPIGIGTATIKITAAPTASISYSSPFCASDSSAQAVTLGGSNAYTGGSYSSTAGLIIDSISGSITPSLSTPANYLVTYTIPASAGCAADSTTANITVTAVPTAAISYLGTPFCSSLATAQAVTLTGTFAHTGGTYSNTSGLSLNLNTGEINPSLSPAGTHTITYTIPASAGCAAVANNTTTVKITAAPTANISYAGTPFCASDSSAQAVTLGGSNAYTGGSYSSTAGLIIDAISGSITPSLSAPANYLVTYTIPASAGCPTDSTTANITVTAVPTATISYLGTPFCSTLATAQVVTLSGTFAFTGGTYSSTPVGLSINGTTGAINPSSSTAGSYTISYTIPATGGCAAIANNTTTVKITAAPTALINYITSPFCASNSSAQAVALSGTNAYTGGSFSSTPGLSLNTSTGAITPSLSTNGNYVVTYTILASDGCGADSTTIANVAVTAVPTATISYLGTPFCSSLATAQAVTLTGTFAHTGGTYSNTSGLSLNLNTGEINPSLSPAGTHTITYTIPASAGCTAVANNTTTLTITAAPTANISYSGTPFCASDASAQAVTLGGANAYTGGSYSSTAGLIIDAISGSITPSLSTAGNCVVTYTIPASAGCAADSTTANVTITAVPTAAISYSSSSFCTTLATAQTVNLSGTGAYIGGSFSSTAGLAIDTTTGAINPSLSIPANYLVTYTIPASAGCAAVANITTNVLINPIPVANPIPTETICSMESTNIALGSTPTGATFDWTVLENSVSGASSGTTDLISQTLTNNSASQGSAVYTITPTLGGCSGLPITATVNVNPLPTVSISGTSTICFGSSTSIDFSGTPNAIVTFTVNGGTNQTVVLDSSGLKSVSTGALNADTTYELVSITTSGTTICSKTIMGSVLISVIPIPLVSTVVASPKVCSGQSTGISLSSNVVNANFSWAAISNNATGENSGTGNIISDNVTATGVVIGSVTYSIIANVGSCSGPVKLETITVNPIPVITLSTSVNNLCSGNTTSFGLNSNVIGTTFSWNVIQTNTLGASDGFGNSITQTLVSTSNNVGEAIYSITPLVNGCPGIPKLATVNVYPIPVASANVTTTTICSGMATNISLSSTVPGTSFNWTVIQSGLFGPSSGSGATISQTLSTIGIITGTVTYTITPEINGCFGNPITVTIIVNPTPEVFGSSAATICSGESPNISLFPSIAATTFSWTVANVGVTGAQSGTGNTIDDILEANSITGTAVYTVTPNANNCSGAPLNISVTVNPLPKPLIEKGIICLDATTNVAFKTYLLDTKLDPSDFDFVWLFENTIINGEVGATLEADVAGTYSVLVTNTVTGCVSEMTSVVVTASFPGTSVSSSQTLAFSDNATVEVTVLGGTATFYYSMDEGALQLSNIFTDVAPGIHSFLVTDINGCTNLPLGVNIIGYPTYFTPNGDGIHDTWNIIGLSSSDKVSIFDRYGKLIKQISAASNGWDGTFNGQMLTATDYWFTIEYVEPSTSENKIFKAHFSLKR